jgi:hypothetical protein
MSRYKVEVAVAGRDDELADFGGEADIALVVAAIATYVAAAALLHRSARSRIARAASKQALAELTSRARRRGGSSLADAISSGPAPGTRAFERLVRSAAAEAAARIGQLARKKLVALFGRRGAGELLDLGPEAFLRGGALSAPEIGALSAHLADGAELAVGQGRGRVFVKQARTPEHKVVEVATETLPDPRQQSATHVRRIRRFGASARDNDVPATLVLVVWAGEQELRLSRDGRDSHGTLVLDGSVNRLNARITGRNLAIEPIASRDRNLSNDWAAIHRALHEDPILADLLGELYAKAGFGGFTEVLQALLELAPLIHAHEQVARRVIRATPDHLQDPMAEVILPLRTALRADKENSNRS